MQFPSLFEQLKRISQCLFLAPTGALEEGILSVRACVRDIPQKNIENEF